MGKMSVIKEGDGLVKAWVDGVEFDDNTKRQALNISRLPFIHKWVALMSDCHLGRGSTVGSIITTKKAIIPASIGVDIGCGMCAVKTNLTASDLPDSLYDVRMSIEDRIPVGHNHHEDNSVPQRSYTKWKALSSGYDELTTRHPELNVKNPVKQLGTLGGGNHFIEICIDENDDVWIMLHSGSRNIGNIIGRLFIAKAKADMRLYHVGLEDQDLAYLPEGTKHFDQYWFAVKWAQNFAASNREVMLYRTLEAFGKALGRKIGFKEKVINCHHNYVDLENHFGENVYVTRKGAIRARVDDLGIIPSAMGQISYIVRGKGNKESFESCSHGAGRRFSRTEAKKRFTVAEHVAATEGVECKKDASVLDETPMAYKNIDAVMKAQEDLVDIIYRLKAVVCIKG